MSRCRHQHDTDTYNYIELCDFFKLSPVSTCQCLYPCFIIRYTTFQMYCQSCILCKHSLTALSIVKSSLSRLRRVGVYKPLLTPILKQYETFLVYLTIAPSQGLGRPSSVIVLTSSMLHCFFEVLFVFVLRKLSYFYP